MNKRIEKKRNYRERLQRAKRDAAYYKERCEFGQKERLEMYNNLINVIKERDAKIEKMKELLLDEEDMLHVVDRDGSDLMEFVVKMRVPICVRFYGLVTEAKIKNTADTVSAKIKMLITNKIHSTQGLKEYNEDVINFLNDKSVLVCEENNGNS